MIVLDLKCAHGHRFDGWFARAEHFEQQRADSQLCCPVCGSAAVERLPSAPSIAGSAASVDRQAEALVQLRHRVRAAEDVGARFPDEARAMHYGDIPPRDIRGTASGRQLKSLLEEGVSVCPVPAVAAEDLH